jgi:predicted nucleotidyltransferase
MVAREKLPVKLSQRETRAVKKFLSHIRKTYGKQIHKVMLFGSKARGEANSDSDIDILLLVADETWTLKDGIVDIVADINLEYDILIDIRVIGIKRWQYMADIQAGLYQTISQDAISLAG